MAKLVDLVWSSIPNMGSNLNEEPLEVNDVDDQPTP